MAKFQIIVSYSKPEEANLLNRGPWQVEIAFMALKTNGFNIEDNLLIDLDRK